MRTAVKLVGWLLALFLVLVVIAAVALRLFVDPNRFRGEISALVAEQTGRQLRLGGDLELSVFPWLGVSAKDVALGNAPGFGDEPFAQVGHAELRAKLLPLLQRRLEVDTVVLDGLVLHLARKADGTTNWQDLTAPRTAPAAPGTPPQPPGHGAGGVAALAVGGLRIHDGQLTWDDRQAGARYELRALELDSGAISLGQPFHADLSFTYAVADGPQGRFKGRSDIAVDPANGRYALRDLALDLAAEGKGVPGGKGQVTASAAALAVDAAAGTGTVERLRAEGYGMRLTGDLRGEGGPAAAKAQGKLDFTVTDAAAAAPLLPASLAAGSHLEADLLFDRAAGTLRAAPLAGQLAKVPLQGELTARQLFTAPALSGRLKTERFSPRELLAALGHPLETTDPKALGSASGAFQFDAAGRSLKLENVDIAVDQSRLTGRVELPSLEGPVVRYDLALDQIDLDRYLPPGSKAPAASPAEAAAGAASRAPAPLLRTLDVDGQLRVGSLKAAGLRMEGLRAVLKGHAGQLHVSPLEARLYGGTYAGNLGLDATGAEPRYSLEESLKGVQLEPLLTDLNGKAPVTGRAAVSAKLTAQGNDAPAVKRTLNGTASFELKDGLVKGVNIGQQLRQGLAALKGQPAPGAEAQETAFSEVSGSFHIANGVARNEDLVARSPLFNVSGKGTVDLVREQLDYGLTVAVVGGGAELAELRNQPVPLRVHGPLAAPKYEVDLKALVEAKGKEALEKEIRKRLGVGEPAKPGQPGAAPAKPEKQLEQELKNQLFDRLLKGR